MILSPVTATPSYAAAMGAVCPDARIICKRDELSDALAGYELSDVLLVLDPRCFAVRDREIESLAGSTYLTTKLDTMVNWARGNSLWPLPFGTACCAIEFMATAASRFDLARFGMERMSFSPRQADVLICAGRLPFKLAPVIRRIWDQMPQPKWAISMGACASSGGIFDNYSMVQGIDTIIPVDVYVPGCPPRPEGLMYGIMLLQKKIKGETFTDSSLREEKLVGPSGLFLPAERVDELSEPFGNSVHQTRSA